MRCLPPSQFFPAADSARADGLVGFGGQLSPEWLLDAYRHGIFPWPCDDLLAWWSPDPRAILELDELHVSRRLARTCRSRRFQVTCNRDFAGVLEGCATAQNRRLGTWLNADLRQAYVRLHELGQAHSVEVWRDGQLAGGTYGVSVGGLFAAESMFYSVRDASKVALVHLVERLRDQGFHFMDIQQLTPHLRRLGARLIPRRDYLGRLASALEATARFDREPPRRDEPTLAQGPSAC